MPPWPGFSSRTSLRGGSSAPFLASDYLLLLADSQTSGGLLVAGELPEAPVIGELVPRRDSVLIIR